MGAGSLLLPPLFLFLFDNYPLYSIPFVFFISFFLVLSDLLYGGDWDKGDQ